MGVTIYSEYATVGKNKEVKLNIKPLSTLWFNDSVVGYRVQYNSKVFDIDVDDGDLLFADFTDLGKDDLMSTPCRYLKPIGNKLSVSEYDTTPEATYRDFLASVERCYDIPNLSKTDVELKRLYNKYNNLIFDGQLAKVTPVYWNGRLTGSAGICKTKVYNGKYYVSQISLSPYYHEGRKSEIDNTLVHEMIHVLYPRCSHGWQFDVTMNEINVKYKPLHVTVHSEERARIKYNYVCFDCGKEYPRARRLDCNTHFCKCGGRLIEEDYE